MLGGVIPAHYYVKLACCSVFSVKLSNNKAQFSLPAAGRFSVRSDLEILRFKSWLCFKLVGPLCVKQQHSLHNFDFQKQDYLSILHLCLSSYFLIQVQIFVLTVICQNKTPQLGPDAGIRPLFGQNRRLWGVLFRQITVFVRFLKNSCFTKIR